MNAPMTSTPVASLDPNAAAAVALIAMAALGTIALVVLAARVVKPTVDLAAAVDLEQLAETFGTVMKHLPTTRPAIITVSPQRAP